MSRELDADIAVYVMGWLRLPEGERGFIDPNRPAIESRLRPEAPHYSTDLNACAQAEARMMERGLGAVYHEALDDVVWECQRSDLRDSWQHELACRTASPEWRCRAMLAALSESE